MSAENYRYASFTLSTAEEEKCLFYGLTSDARDAPEERELPEGQYRIVDGELVRIERGSPLGG